MVEIKTTFYYGNNNDQGCRQIVEYFNINSLESFQ
jgi:hypothetical protein